ncbi:hypothetical protein [Micrococcus sp.]|uniref:hypothetical protein n=1 Tax=Micrococcus sp. TaxID=1271 RepID=UPI0026DDA1F3|nr:hypothetical protein [Micrococcus sp.]MDO4240878.1 hypothetical protein [Micrococcus sp.]
MNTDRPAGRVLIRRADDPEAPWQELEGPVELAQGERYEARTRHLAPLPPLHFSARIESVRVPVDFAALTDSMRQAPAAMEAGMRGLGEALAQAVEFARTVEDTFTEPVPDRPGTYRARRYGQAAQRSPFGPTHGRRTRR